MLYCAARRLAAGIADLEGSAAPAGGRLQTAEAVYEYLLTETARRTLESFDPVTDPPTLNCPPAGVPSITSSPYPMRFVDEGGRTLLRLEEHDAVRTIGLARARAMDYNVDSYPHSSSR